MSFTKVPGEMKGVYKPDISVLYGEMYSRYLLSASNPHFHDENGEIFIHYSVPNVQFTLCCGRTKAEGILDSMVKKGIIRRETVEIGMPARIYLLVFYHDTPPVAPVNGTSRNYSVEQSVVTQAPSPACCSAAEYEHQKALVFEQIEADVLMANYPQDKEEIEGIILVMTDVLTSHSPTIRIGRADRDTRTVIQQFKRIDSECVVAVLEEIHHYMHPIENISAFIRTALYNSSLYPFRIDNQIAMDQVN